MNESIHNAVRQTLLDSNIKRVRHTVDVHNGDILELDLWKKHPSGYGYQFSTVKISVGRNQMLEFELDIETY